MSIFTEEYKEAIDWYDKALEIKPDYAQVSTNKQMALKKLKKDKGFFSRFRKRQKTYF